MRSRRICAVALAAFVSAIVGSLTVAWVHAGTGPSQTCDAGTRILTMPVTVAVAVNGSPTSPSVQVCYSTTPDGQAGSETAGGAIVAGANLTGTTVTTMAQCSPDASANVTVGCNPTGTVGPTFSIVGPDTSGALLSVSIPFQVCAGQCVGEAPGVGTTGVVVGQLQALSAPPGTTGAGYQLTGVTLYVAGVPVGAPGAAAGVYANPAQVGFSLVAGPCILGECLPLNGYVETTGNPLLVLVTPLGTNSAGAPPTCIYNNGTSCPSASASATIPVPSISVPPIPTVTVPPLPTATIPPVPTVTVPPIPTATVPPIPTLPSVSPPAVNADVDAASFLGATGSLYPPIGLAPVVGTYTFSSVECADISHDVADAVVDAGGCIISALGTFASTTCGTGTTGGAPTGHSDSATLSTSGLALGGGETLSVNYGIVFVAGIGIIEGVESADGDNVFGVADEFPTGGDCVNGVTQMTMLGGLTALP